MASWIERQAALARLAEQQLFFVGGAPRSGTTWLQQILGSHPDISCEGEGLFWRHIALPVETLVAERRSAIAAKNSGFFGHTGGYPLPTGGDTDFLIGTAILLALAQQAAGGPYRAIGEKTPENLFLFPRLKQLFPTAKFIAIARDPRDVLTSAWHFFHKSVQGEDEVAAKIDFIRGAMPSLDHGARAAIAFAESNPDHVMSVTYEALAEKPEDVVAGLFRFLGMADCDAIVEESVRRTSFAASAGRPAGMESNGAFLRKGVAGDWASTLTPMMNDMILAELGWMFPHFGWRA